MAVSSKGASLTEQEKRIVKALLNNGWRNQDIHALVNSHRTKTVNFGRFASIKKSLSQAVASKEELDFYFLHKRAYDPQTGLNFYDDERLIRARESMILAVQIFNSAALNFKTEVFTVLANIAWTYLLHEFYHRKGEKLVANNGNSLLLSQMIGRPDCPLPEGVRANIRILKDLRDKVEHLMLGKSDLKWQSIFQACCLNFDHSLCTIFGKELTLSKDLSFALQFSKLNMQQTTTINKYEIPEQIAALDAQLLNGIDPEVLNSLEFQFKVIYTLDATSKNSSHFQFVNPSSAEGKKIHNVLIQTKPADELYPHRALMVVKLVKQETGLSFTSNDHTKAWHYFKVRPKTNASKPEHTNKKFCLYHKVHKDYTYSNDWVDFLAEAINDPAKFQKIRSQTY